MSQAAHIIRFDVRPECADDLQEVFGRALPHILEDTTTVSWFVGREDGDRATFVLAHAFVDADARSAHFDSPAAKLIMTEGAPFFASEPTIEDVAVIAGGSSES